MSRQINQAGLDLIKRFEQCRLDAYPDPGTKGPPWTIGWGHTGPDVRQGDKINQDEADQLLSDDVAKVSAQVDGLAPPCTSNQFSALVSFAYNAGFGHLRGSTLMGKMLAGDIAGAAREFTRWVYGGGHVLPGLVVRREAEQRLFLTPDDTEA